MRSYVDTRDRVRDLLAEGYGRLEAARILGVSKSTVSYHARRLGLPIDENVRKRSAGRRPTGDLLTDHRRQRGEGTCDEV